MTSEHNLSSDNMPEASGASQGTRRPPSVLFWAQTLAMAALLTRPIRYARESMLTFVSSSTAEWDVDPSKLAIGVALVLFVMAILLRPRLKTINIHRSSALFLTLLTGWAFLSLTWAYSPSVSLHANLQLLMYFVIFILIVNLTPRYADLDRWGRVFLWLALVNCVSSMIEVFAYDVVGAVGVMGEGKRFSFIASFPQRGLPALAFALHYTLYGEKRGQKALGLLAVAASIASIYFSARRAGLLGVFVVFLLYGVMVGYRHKSFRRITLAAAAAVALLIVLSPSFGERMAKIPIVGEVEFGDWGPEDIDRVAQYQAGFILTANNPWTGIGLHGPMLWIKDVMGFYRYLGQHSMFLALSSGLGFPGLLLYLFFLGAVTRAARKAIQAHRRNGHPERASLVAAAVCALGVLIFYGQFVSLLTQPPVYIVAGLCVAAAGKRHLEDGQSESA